MPVAHNPPRRLTAIGSFKAKLRSLNATEDQNANSSGATDGVEPEAAASTRSDRQVSKKRKRELQADTLHAQSSAAEQEASAKPAPTNLRQAAPETLQRVDAQKRM